MEDQWYTRRGDGDGVGEVGPLFGLRDSDILLSFHGVSASTTFKAVFPLETSSLLAASICLGSRPVSMP